MRIPTTETSLTGLTAFRYCLGVVVDGQNVAVPITEACKGLDYRMVHGLPVDWQVLKYIRAADACAQQLGAEVVAPQNYSLEAWTDMAEEQKQSAVSILQEKLCSVSREDAKATMYAAASHMAKLFTSFYDECGEDHVAHDAVRVFGSPVLAKDITDDLVPAESNAEQAPLEDQLEAEFAALCEQPLTAPNNTITERSSEFYQGMISYTDIDGIAIPVRVEEFSVAPAVTIGSTTFDLDIELVAPAVLEIVDDVSPAEVSPAEDSTAAEVSQADEFASE